MARQTARHTGSVESFLTQFGARLQALAASHDLLVRESWYGASLGELIRSQLGGYLDGSTAQVSIEGPAIALKPEAAQNLGLALHELAEVAILAGIGMPPGGAFEIVVIDVAESDHVHLSRALDLAQVGVESRPTALARRRA